MKIGDAIELVHVSVLLSWVTACGSESTSGLFEEPGIGAPSSGSGGVPSYVSTGGAGGAENAGGVGGTVGTGSTGGVGGSSVSPGDAGGASFGSDSSTSGEFDPLLCDFTGTWASYVRVPVTWPASLVLLAGSGALHQWNLTKQVQAPGALTVSASTVPCGIFLPDLQSNFFQANAKFGIRFPDALFDGGGIPVTNFEIHPVMTPAGIGFETETFATLIGLSLANPTTSTWPGAQAKLEDHDNDGKIGITVLPVTGAGYSLPPGSSNPFDPNRADLIYIAERTVSKIRGPIVDCDQLDAEVLIETLNNKPAIDSTVVGCHKIDGTECSPEDAAFIDGNRPQFTPSGSGAMINVRVADDTTCAGVRALFPMQP